MARREHLGFVVAFSASKQIRTGARGVVGEVTDLVVVGEVSCAVLWLR